MFSFFKSKSQKVEKIVINNKINVGKQKLTIYYVDEGNNKQIVNTMIYGTVHYTLFDFNMVDRFFQQGYIKMDNTVIPIKQVVRMELGDIESHIVTYGATCEES